MKSDIIKALNQILQYSDFFYSSQMLRFHGQDQYRTKTGGILSLLIIITIAIGFASRIIDTLHQNTIICQLQVIKNTQPSPVSIQISPQNNFMFGIQVWLQNLNQANRLFDLKATLFSQQYGSANTTTLPLVQCTQSHWDSLPQFKKKFQKLEMHGWMCPPINSTYQLLGKYTSAKYQQVQFSIGPCKNQTDLSRPCFPQQVIDKMWQQNSNGLYFTFYYINTLINSGEKQGISYYLQDMDYVMFSKTVGAQAYLYITDFTMNTDTSLLPFQNIQSQNGIIAEQRAVQHTHIVAQGGDYVNFYIAKSANSLVYTRSVNKLSDVLSFMGGMIGAISALLFILNLYTNFSFEATIALTIFTPQPQDQFCDSKKKLKMNFLLFARYIYWWIKSKIGLSNQNIEMNYLHECRLQIMKQLDIHLIIKRIALLQYSMTYLFQDLHIEALQLSRPNSLEKIREVREKLQNIDITDLSDYDYLSKGQIPTKTCNNMISAHTTSPTKNICIGSIVEAKMLNLTKKLSQQEQIKQQESKSNMNIQPIGMYDSVIEIQKEKQVRFKKPSQGDIIIQDISEENQSNRECSKNDLRRRQTIKKTKNMKKLLKMNDDMSLKIISKLKKTHSLDVMDLMFGKKQRQNQITTKSISPQK